MAPKTTESGWDEAIRAVLNDAPEAMHYKAIAEEIENRELRQNLGATPANTVNAYLNNSINYDENSPYLRTGRGFYILRETNQASVINKEDELDGFEPSGLIHSLGMFWRHSEVMWKPNPKILGQQQSGSDYVNFSGQLGIYLLHDRSRVIYVGRSIDRPMGQRLFEHTKDRLSGRWDRFSWFGLKSVSDTGELNEIKLAANDIDIVIATLEAVLIEALEPPQNRKRGDQFSAVEYLQVSDPEKNKQKIDAITALISGSLVDPD